VGSDATAAGAVVTNAHVAALGVAPPDTHNRVLVGTVHPPGWRNPEPPGRYHVVVVGAGTAGLVTAAIAAGLGARVALIERHLMGGDCLNVGCVPSKAVIRAARAWHDARAAAPAFGGPTAGGAGDFGAVMERMRRLRAGISPVDGAERFRSLGVDVFLGSGRFTAADVVEVGDRVLRFRRAVIATGARAVIPPIDGLADAEPLTNETVFNLTVRPERLLVLGGGPIGVELAQSFARFGSRVTLVNDAAHVLPRDDAEAAAVVQRALGRDGVEVVNGTTLDRVVRDGDVIRARVRGRADEVVADRLLVAAGRVPNVEALGLDAAGVDVGRAGIVVDDRMRTTNRRVYAIGDVASAHRFTHAADFQARLVVQNALFGGRARASRLIVPWVTYSSPELAQVGLTAESARARGVAVDTITVALDDVDRAVLDGAADGFFRVHLARGTDRIVGATLVAAHAGDMIGEIVVAMTNGIGLGGIGRAIHPYPTQAEVFRKAADHWRRGRLTPFVRRALGWWFRVTA
jgi:pyruvate/2-oxoglutarate dehydrogenase complex dihydrolipoamide dehydrogenase (E3) component